MRALASQVGCGGAVRAELAEKATTFLWMTPWTVLGYPLTLRNVYLEYHWGGNEFL